MFGPCCSPPMLLCLLVLLSLAKIEARDLDLLDGGVQKWTSSARVTRCPVHSEIQPVAADGGKGVSFVVKAQSTKRFSLLEQYMPAGGLGGYNGLQLNFSTSGLGSWKLRVYDGQTNIRFVYIVNKPDGAHSLTLPWSSFRAERCKKLWNTNTNGVSVQPSGISHLAIHLPNGRQQAQLTIQGMHAMRDLSAMTVAAKVTAGDDVAEGFDGPFVGMGITGNNDFPMMSVNSPAECAAACKKTAGCRSFDYGARGQVTGECWLSLADRQSAGNAYRSWQLYNYYEITGASPDAEKIKVTEMSLSKEDMAAVMGYVDGPFVGMGITGHNDFAMMSVKDPAECAEACTRTADCRSFDHGARGTAVGECWLSLADRKIAGDAYRSWELYDYYEIKASVSTEIKASDDTKSFATPLEGVKEVDMAAAKKGADSPPDLSGSTASNAQRLSPNQMACMQAVGVLVIFFAL